MSDEQEQGNTTQRQPEEGGRLNTLFIKSPVGVLLIVNFILSFLCFCMMSGWLGDTGFSSGFFGFYLYAVTHTWISLLITFIFILVKLPAHCGIINWDLTFCINTFILVIILLIGSSVVAQRTAKYSDYCDYFNCALTGTCAFFGFACMVGCGIQCFFHYKKWKE